MHLIVNGILIGLLLSIMAGPIFITIIQMGVERGVRAGMAFSAGVLISDCLYFYLVLLGLENIATIPAFKFYVGVIGGILLIIFGGFSLVSKYKKPEEIGVDAKSYWGYFLKGAAINVFNPFVFILWTVISQDMINQGFNFTQQMIYFFAIILTVGLIDLLKLVLAKSIRPYLKPHHLSKVSKISGIGLIIFGVVLILRVL